MLLSGVGAATDGRERRSAHVIVCGNEKGGSGKSTTAMHLAVALLNQATPSPPSTSTAASSR